MKKAILIRNQDDGKQTVGEIIVYDGIKRIFEATTLERSDKNNQPNISCIPRGLYKVVPRYSAKYKSHYHINGVVGRSLILLHWGNYHRQTQGCILIGKSLCDLDKDGHLDVTNSVATFSAMKKAIGKEDFLLQIV